MRCPASPFASHANARCTSPVLPQGPVAIRDQEIGPGTEYYLKAIDVIELQVARAGVRLAAWLDRIAASIATAGHGASDETLLRQQSDEGLRLEAEPEEL